MSEITIENMRYIVRFDRNNKTKNKAGTLVKNGSTHGWLLKINNQTVKYCRLFSDNKCGGKDKALKQALLVRDRYLKNPEKFAAWVLKQQKSGAKYDE